ncbi:MAG: hypothetical protein OXF54_05885 [Caldilineaceae bacterium]|nr:hypothetical protein [Caldilineaceae bacterium]
MSLAITEFKRRPGRPTRLFHQYDVISPDFALKALRQARPVPRLHQKRDRRQPQSFLQVDKLTKKHMLLIV